MERQPLDWRQLGRFPLDREQMEGQQLDRRGVDSFTMEGAGMGLVQLELTPPRSRGQLERRVGVVIAAQIAVACAFSLVSAAKGVAIGLPLPIMVLAAAFAIAGSFEMPLEFRRHNFTFTLAEAALVVGFFIVGPLGLGLAAALGEGIDLVVQRSAPIKVTFNVANRLAAATAAGVAFSTFGRADLHEGLTWVAALVAALCFSIVDVVSTAAVLSIVEQTRFHDIFVSSAATGVLATLASAPVGLIALELGAHGPFMPLILCPLAVAVALNSKYAVAQRDEHLRFERLYQSLARSTILVALDEALGALAGEARSLGTASAALCCATNVDGEWIGTRADDTGRHAESGAVVAIAVALADRASGEEIDIADAPELAAIAADATSAVVLSSVHENAGRVVLVVVRDGSANQTAKSRVETLSAFAHQAALIVSNALLHEERASALARQIDLNRQKNDFVAAVSHELRTPLGVMLGSVQTLKRLQGRMTDLQREQLFDMTVDQGARLQRLIEELLLVAAAEHTALALDHDVIEPLELLASIASNLTPSVRDRLVYRSGADDLIADRSKLERILLNLVENAAKYAPDGAIEVNALRVGTDVHFSVVDHGPGIPVEDRERVFEQFVQLDQSSTRCQGGTGLGLHLCRQLTVLIDGELRLHETPGGGCTFTLTIPDADPAVCDGSVQAYSAVRERPRQQVAR
jgi:signal transduction histidine kinase